MDPELFSALAVIAAALITATGAVIAALLKRGFTIDLRGCLKIALIVLLVLFVVGFIGYLLRQRLVSMAYSLPDGDMSASA